METATDLLALLKSWYIPRIMMQVSPQSTPLEIERFIERAKQAYDERLAAKLEPEHTGEIVAIEPDSGDYFLGKDEIEAADNARAAGHDGPFYFLRVGSRYTHRLSRSLIDTSRVDSLDS
jgi:hypothetical protein